MTVLDRGRLSGPLFIEAQARDLEAAPDKQQRVDLVFKALADCTRRKILCLLSTSSHSVTDIVDQFHLTQPSISRHLAILRGAGLVAFERQGQRLIYRLGDAEPVELAMSFLAELNGSSGAVEPERLQSREN